MSESSKSAWLSLAETNLGSAEVLYRLDAERHCRSIVSRSYYACAAASHAILLSLGYEPPAYGNWPNNLLPSMLLAALKNRNVQDARWRALGRQHSKELNWCWTRRLVADYAPAAGVSAKSHAAPALVSARRLVGTAKDLLP